MAEHTRYICHGNHDMPGCQFCDGGLFACTVCGGFEGTLTTDCPGHRKEKAGASQTVLDIAWETIKF